MNLTIQNRTKENLVFTKVRIELSQFKKHPRSSSSNNDLASKILSSIGAYDLKLESEEGIYTYSLMSPIMITAKDAATISIRLHCDLEKKHVVPNQLGEFKFRILLLTNECKGIESNYILLGT